MANDQSRLDRIFPAKDVEIGPADGSKRYAYDSAVYVCTGSLDFFDTNIVLSMKNIGLHPGHGVSLFAQPYRTWFILRRAQCLHLARSHRCGAALLGSFLGNAMSADSLIRLH